MAITTKDIQERIRRIQQARLERGSETSQEHSDSVCRKCDGNGALAQLDNGELVSFRDYRVLGMNHSSVPCSCIAERAWERQWSRNYLLEACKTASLKDFQVDGRPECIKQARDIAVRYLKSFFGIRHMTENSILFLGAPGTGKTHLLRCVTRGLMDKGVRVHPFEWIAGMDELKSDMEMLQERKDALKNAPVLFIDDLYQGRDRATEFVMETFFDIVDYRYTKHLPMLVSSNRRSDELTAQHDTTLSAIGERLFEMSKGHRAMMALTPDEEKSGMELSYRMLK